jgi:hypothetical protein
VKNLVEPGFKWETMDGPFSTHVRVTAPWGATAEGYCAGADWSVDSMMLRLQRQLASDYRDGRLWGWGWWLT